MDRVTRYPPKAKTKYMHEVTIRHSECGQAWIWDEAARIGGSIDYKKRSPFWAITIMAFDSREKAAELEGLLRRRRHDEELQEARPRAPRVQDVTSQCSRRSDVRNRLARVLLV